MPATKRSNKNPEGHQASKAKATRDKILAAVIALIKESGFSAASSTAIAKKAGITWGAVQHHFGSKEEILQAVVELSSSVYLEQLDSPQLKAGTLQQRVDSMIDIFWQHYSSDLYIAFVEIIMATRGKKRQLSLSRASMQRLLQRNIAIMEDVFQDHAVSNEKLLEAMRFTHRFFAGFALDRVIDPDRPYEEMHVQRIKAQLHALIASE